MGWHRCAIYYGFSDRREPLRAEERRSSMIPRPALILVAVSVSVLAACGSDRDSPADSSPTGDELVGTTFDSTDVSGHNLVPGSMITIGFEDDNLAVEAGCNSMSAAFNITNGNLDVGVMTTTEMACDAALMAQDLWLNDFLTNGPSIESDRETLTLSGGDVTISLAARQPVVLEGTTWVVTGTIVGDLVSTTPGGALASMTITDGVAAIETGCNSGSSTVEVTETTVTFDPMALTRKACLSDEAALEQSVLAVLDGEVSYELDNDMLVIRSNSTGDELGLTFVAS